MRGVSGRPVGPDRGQQELPDAYRAGALL